MKKSKKKKNYQNRSILVTTYIFLAVFLGLIGYMVYFDVVKAEGVINSPYNKRQEALEKKVKRGNILTADGNVIATTITDSDGNDTRYYPYNGLFAHVAGYINNGGYGLESSACYYMLTSNQNPFEQLANDLSGEKNIGDNLVTTLDYGLQQISYDALGDNRGAVVITEPSTGKILAMVSKPDFNPNTLAIEWDSITGENADSVLINRATQGLYPPGSTFKLVTLLEYIRENPNSYEEYEYTCNGGYSVDEQFIACSHGTKHGQLDWVKSLANSCNASFINMGLRLKISDYILTAEELLFNRELPLDMEYNKSSFSLTEDASQWEIAQTSFGQGTTLITPVHLAMIGSTIANDGMLMKPYVMDSIESTNGVTIKKFNETEYGQLITADEAALLKQGMEQVIEIGLAELYGGCDYTLAGKTGTAQYGTRGYEHSLFVSYSPAKDPEICVTVVVEGGEQRNISAAEVAKKIYDYYYAH